MIYSFAGLVVRGFYDRIRFATGAVSLTWLRIGAVFHAAQPTPYPQRTTMLSGRVSVEFLTAPSSLLVRFRLHAEDCRCHPHAQPAPCPQGTTMLSGCRSLFDRTIFATGGFSSPIFGFQNGGGVGGGGFREREAAPAIKTTPIPAFPPGHHATSPGGLPGWRRPILKTKNGGGSLIHSP
jgi:hypothetical protein